MKTLRPCIKTTIAAFIVAVCCAVSLQAQSLPNDFQRIYAGAIPESTTVLYRISEWPGPPLPIGVLQELQGVQPGDLYYSPSLQAVFWNDSAIAAAGADAAPMLSRAQFDVQPMDDSSGDGDGSSGWNYGTNDLWLEPLGFSTNSTFQMTIHAPQPDAFDLLLAPSLNNLKTPFSWFWVTRAEPGDTNLDIANLPPDMGFFILGATNSTFGDFSDAWKLLSGLDTNAYYDPTISFKISFPKAYVNTTMITGSVQIISGYPNQMAILVNPSGSDLTNANWTWLSTSFPVTLSNTGPNEIYVGLQGPLPGIGPVWNHTTVTLDQTAPVLQITGPASNAVPYPLIQLVGYSDKPLSSLSFGTAGQATQRGFVTSQYYDSALQKLTTNFWQCYDVFLGEGSTTVTVQATDLAGNSTTANYTFNFTTNNLPASPTVQLIYPQDGMSVCDSALIIQGQVDDASVSVQATLVNTNGTQGLVGLMERSGRWWIDGVGLADDTNTLIVTVTDVAGNSSTTNITVVKSDVNLTINPMPSDQFWQSNTTVTGTVQDDTYSVTVNGVEAQVNSDGTWSAQNVPITGSGTVCFYAQASASGQSQMSRAFLLDAEDQGSQPVYNAESINITPSRLHVAKYYVAWYHEPGSSSGSGGGGGRQPLVMLTESITNSYWMDFSEGAAGSGWQAAFGVMGGVYAVYVTNFLWAAQQVIVDGGAPQISGMWSNSANSWTCPVYLENCAVTNRVSTTNYNGSVTTDNYWRIALTSLQLVTGGRSLVQKSSLFLMKTSATNLINQRWPVYQAFLGDTNLVPASSLTIGTLGKPSDDGSLYIGLPDNATLDATLYVDGASSGGLFYAYGLTQEKFNFEIYRGSVRLTGQSTNVSVGEQVALSFQLEKADPGQPDNPPAVTNCQWTVPGPTFADYFATNDFAAIYPVVNATNTTIVYYYRDSTNAFAQCSVTTMGQTLTNFVSISVQKPATRILATLTGTVAADFDWWPWEVPAIHFGRTNGPAGISFEYTTDKSVAGQYQWVQVGEAAVLITTNNQHMEATGVGLDTQYPYFLDDRSRKTSDSPSIGPLMDPETSRTDWFTMHLMFLPDKGDSSLNRWVSVRTVGWGWYGDAQLNNGVPLLVNSSRVVLPPGDVDATNNPTWTQNMTNTLNNFSPVP